jgi:hypothetical protein
MKIITVTIEDDGSPSVDLAGYAGKGCQVVQDVFGRAFGKTTKTVSKPEFNKPTLDNLKVRG